MFVDSFCILWIRPQKALKNGISQSARSSEKRQQSSHTKSRHYAPGAIGSRRHFPSGAGLVSGPRVILRFVADEVREKLAAVSRTELVPEWLVRQVTARPFLFLPNRTFSSSSSSFSLLQHLPYRHCVQHLYNQSIILSGAQNEYIVYDAAIR